MENIEDAGQEIFDAILTRHWLQFRIGKAIHVVEPHAYGVMHDGHHALWAWNLLVAGPVQSGWMQFRLNEMRHVQRLSTPFQGTRPDYKRPTTMREIHKAL